jgi:hypothetical protein
MGKKTPVGLLKQKLFAEHDHITTQAGSLGSAAWHTGV